MANQFPWSHRVISGIALLIFGTVSGCTDAPPLTTMAPPGQQVDTVFIDPNSDINKAVSIGEEINRLDPEQSEMIPQSQLRAPTPVGEVVTLGDLDLKYSTLKAGDPAGATAVYGDLITVHYDGTLEDGSVFDSSRKRGEPFTCSLKTGSPRGVIRGWVEGIPGMLVGEIRRLEIPAELAYGSMERPGIPANSKLIFEVELLSIQPRTGG